VCSSDLWPLALSLTGYGFLRILGPLVPLVILVSVVSNLAQVGLLLSLKAALPKLENLSPAKWFKKTFSKSNLFDLFKNIVKVAVLIVVVWRVLEVRWGELFVIPLRDIRTMNAIIGSTLDELLMKSAVAFAALAAVDFIYQRFKFAKDNRMSKDEVKREYKEMEGDPLIKSKRRQLHQDLASQNAMGRVKQAKVLVTNPTHYAVALDYEEGRTPLPLILAKGEGELARRMIEVARREGVPILREAALARSLFEEGLENAYIPKSLIGPVAEVLRWVRELNGNRS
jgi:type III secretion protein U